MCIYTYIHTHARIRAPTRYNTLERINRSVEISSASELWILRTSQRASTRRYLLDFQGQFANYSRVLPFSVTWQISPSSPLIIAPVHSNKVSKRNELFIAVDPYAVHRFSLLSRRIRFLLLSSPQSPAQPLSLSLFILRSLVNSVVSPFPPRVSPRSVAGSFPYTRGHRRRG